MANASIGGLVSGLDTATIISQLMQLEAQPQSRLKVRAAGEETAITSLQALNTKLAGIATKAAELASGSTWSATKAATDSEHVTASTRAGTAAATVTFDVVRLATRSQASYATAATSAAAGVVPAGATLEVARADGSSQVLDVGTGSLQDVTAALNGTGTGLTAALVRAGTDTDGVTPTYRLSVSSAATGAGTGFTLSVGGDPAAFLGGVTGSAVTGQDAEIQVSGMPGTLTSASNTFTDLVPGVDVTLRARPTAPVTVTVTPDATALAEKVKALLEAVGSAVSDIDKLTNYDPVTKRAGLAAGDSTLRSVRDQLLSTFVGSVDGQPLADLGMEVDRYGTLTFDADRFAAAYAAAPARVGDAFVVRAGDGGLAAGLESLGKQLSNSSDGLVTSLVKGRSSTLEGLNDAIERWDSRLSVRRASLERQYGALEVALGRLQSQSQWLAGQISSLPRMSNG